MNEKTAQYVKLLKSNIDRIFIVVLSALLLVMGFLWWNEQAASAVPVEQVKSAKLVDEITNNPQYKRIALLGQKRDISQDEMIDQIRKYNMFDYKSVKQTEMLQKEAQQKLTQAQAAAGRGNNEEAKRLLKEVLTSFPSHQKARELMNQLNSGKPAQATPAVGVSAPAPTPVKP